VFVVLFFCTIPRKVLRPAGGRNCEGDDGMNDDDNERDWENAAALVVVAG
jgi:hypothetical protein